MKFDYWMYKLSPDGQITKSHSIHRFTKLIKSNMNVSTNNVWITCYEL